MGAALTMTGRERSVLVIELLTVATPMVDPLMLTTPKIQQHSVSFLP